MSAAGAVMIVGAGMSAYGQAQADMAQAESERDNADFYDLQGKHALESSEREANIFEQEADQAIGSQISSFAKAGVDISGSPLVQVAESEQRKTQEIQAINREGRMQWLLASKRASMARANADAIESTSSMRQMGTLLGGAGQVAASSGS